MEIGKAIEYDFAKDFPALFDPNILANQARPDYGRSNAECQKELQSLWVRYAKSLEYQNQLRQTFLDLEKEHNNLLKLHQELLEQQKS